MILIYSPRDLWNSLLAPHIANVTDVPEKPHQPKCFRFPKRSFGQKTVVHRSFQLHWFTEWPFLHYNEASDVVFCHTCLMARKLNLVKSSSADAAFVSMKFFVLGTITNSIHSLRLSVDFTTGRMVLLLSRTMRDVQVIRKQLKL